MCVVILFNIYIFNRILKLQIEGGRLRHVRSINYNLLESQDFWQNFKEQN